MSSDNTTRRAAIQRLIFLAKEESAGRRGITPDGTFFHVIDGDGPSLWPKVIEHLRGYENGTR